MPFKTRIAPTPSGYLHLGNAWSFALTAAIAKHHNASVLLRIDDLDRERINSAYVQDVFDTLNFLQIPWQEGPANLLDYENTYSQVHRLPLYQTRLQQLRDEGRVFACECSRAQILRDNPDGVYPGTCRHKSIPLDAPGVQWRLDTSAEIKLVVGDLAGNVTHHQLPPAMQYFVVRKKDGYPAYQLASVADDVHYGVNLIVRGADLWDSTLAQLYLAQVLGLDSFTQTRFHHHELMMAGPDKKLSKSDGATSIQYLRKQGKTVADIYTLIGEMAGIQHLQHWISLTAM